MARFTAENNLAVAGERLELAKRRETELAARISIGKSAIEKAEALINERMGESDLLNEICISCDKYMAESDSRLASLVQNREAKEKELNEMRARQKTVAAQKEEGRQTRRRG